MDVTSGCVVCSLMLNKAMTLPMSGRLAPLSPDSLSPHDHIAYHGTGEMGAFHTGYFGGRGRSLWGTAIVSCMSMRLYKFSSFEYKFFVFWEGGIHPLHETLGGSTSFSVYVHICEVCLSLSLQS